MSKEKLPTNNGAEAVASENNTVIGRSYEEHERKEREKLEKYNQMVKLAEEMGGGWFEGHWGFLHLGFNEWSDALAFKDLCNEKKFRVKIYEPSPRANDLENYYKVIPE